MTQEEKQLLLKELCARFPYGVICQLSCKGSAVLITEKLGLGGLEHFIAGSMCVKPFLRSMSTMTEEEKKEYHAIDSRAYTCPEDIAHIPAADRIDWLTSHHFDYRGLIPMGLALEAPKDMYKTK